MSKLVIVGASAMGRETFTYATEAGMDVRGFLDSRADILDGRRGYPPIIGSVESHEIRPDDVFVVAIGDPAAKMRYAVAIRERGGKFVNVVHPTAYLGMNVTLGTGCIIAPHVSITNDTVIGDHVILNLNASVNHDNRIGDGCTICPGARLAGRVAIGENVFVGTGATVIPDVELGSGVLVAAGAVVTKSFEAGTLFGIPAVTR